MLNGWGWPELPGRKNIWKSATLDPVRRQRVVRRQSRTDALRYERMQARAEGFEVREILTQVRQRVPTSEKLTRSVSSTNNSRQDQTYAY